MTFDAFIETAWNDHVHRPAEVAERLAASLDQIARPADISAFSGLAVHLYGEHLGRWADGIALVEGLRKSPHWDGSADVERAVRRGTAALRFADGDAAATEGLETSDAIAVLGTAASALGARNDWPRAITAFDRALELGRQGGLDPRANRALAVAGNNMAAALEGKADRSESETATMLRAAQAGLTYWRLAGTWVEEERAEYRFAESLIQAGDFAGAIDHARRCVALCETHDATPFDRFFGHTALALAARGAGDPEMAASARERALQWHAAIAEDSKHWCAADLARLG